LEAWAVVVPRAINADERRDQEKLETSTGLGKTDASSQTRLLTPKIRKEKKSGAPSEGVEEERRGWYGGG
jgi:hypothetical protein